MVLQVKEVVLVKRVVPVVLVKEVAVKPLQLIVLLKSFSQLEVGRRVVKVIWQQ